MRHDHGGRLIDAGLGAGAFTGGNLVSQVINVNGRGKLIGNVTLTGGGLGSTAGTVAIRSYDPDTQATLPLAGDVGNILIKPVRYKTSLEQQDVLDKDGNPVLDKNGNPKTTWVTLYAQQGGGVYLDLDSAGKLGNVTAVGGDLAGTIHAAKGMGNLTLTALFDKNGTNSGVQYTENSDSLVQANLSADLSAEPGAKNVAISAIKVTGGSVTGAIGVIGKITSITTAAVGVSDPYAGSFDLYGGNVSSATITATAIGDISLTGGGLGSALTADSIGAISVLGGAIGAVDGADSACSLTATQSIGNISVKIVAINSAVQHYPGEADWYPTTALIFGGDLNVTIHLGQLATGLNTKATLGTITGTGANVTVAGETPLDPVKFVRDKVNSKVLTYIDSWDPDDNNKPVKVTADLGGTKDGSQLTQLT